MSGNSHIYKFCSLLLLLLSYIWHYFSCCKLLSERGREGIMKEGGCPGGAGSLDVPVSSHVEGPKDSATRIWDCSLGLRELLKVQFLPGVLLIPLPSFISMLPLHLDPSNSLSSWTFSMAFCIVKMFLFI